MTAPTTSPRPGVGEPAVQVEIANVLGHVDLQEAAKQLNAVLHHDTEVCVSLAGVDVPDTASLQLFVAFARERRQASRRVSWANTSQSLRNAAALLDLHTHLFQSDSPCQSRPATTSD